MKSNLLIILLVSLLFAVTPCGYEEWVQGVTVVVNGDKIVNNGLVFEAQNSPSSYETPPSSPVDNLYWVYLYECVDDTTADRDAFMAGFGLAVVSGVVGLSIGHVVKLLKFLH